MKPTNPINTIPIPDVTNTSVVGTEFGTTKNDESSEVIETVSNTQVIQDATFKVIKIFEDVLYKNNMKIPDEHRLGEEDEACIFGLTYYDIEDKVKEILQDLVVRGQQ